MFSRLKYSRNALYINALSYAPYFRQRFAPFFRHRRRSQGYQSGLDCQNQNEQITILIFYHDNYFKIKNLYRWTDFSIGPIGEHGSPLHWDTQFSSH